MKYLFDPVVKILFLAGLLFALFGEACAQKETGIGKLRIAASQFPVSADIDSNYYWIKKHMLEARENDAHIIHFPECALSGYAKVDFDSFDQFDWKRLIKNTNLILSLADELDLWVLLGSSHRLSGENKPHNSLYLINPAGEIVDRYDKRFCTSGDLKHYSPGDHFVTFDINGVKCGLLICYDIRFPELYRAYVQEGIHLLFQSFYNARQKPGGIHPKIMPVSAQARAATNAFFISLTNSSAPNSWPCHFITPNGLIADKLPANKPGLLISELDIHKKYYDASKPFRQDAINGKLNSGEIIDDARSKDRRSIH